MCRPRRSRASRTFACRGRPVPCPRGRTRVRAATAAGGRPPPAQALIYPALDFVLDTPSHHDLEDAHIIPRDRILWYADQYLPAGIDRLDPRASPLRARNLGGQPPTLLITAGFDPLPAQGLAYAATLRAANVAVAYHEYS